MDSNVLHLSFRSNIPEGLIEWLFPAMLLSLEVNARSRPSRERLFSFPKELFSSEISEGLMKVALLQLNPTVGDLSGNARLIAEAVRGAGNVDLSVTSEMALLGYPARDLLLQEGFVRRSWEILEMLASELKDACPVLVGLAEPNPGQWAVLSSTPLPCSGGAGWRGPLKRRCFPPTMSLTRTDTLSPPAASDPGAGGDSSRHLHLRGHLERSRFLEAPALSHRPIDGAGGGGSQG